MPLPWQLGFLATLHTSKVSLISGEFRNLNEPSCRMNDSFKRDRVQGTSCKLGRPTWTIFCVRIPRSQTSPSRALVLTPKCRMHFILQCFMFSCHSTHLKAFKPSINSCILHKHQVYFPVIKRTRRKQIKVFRAAGNVATGQELSASRVE